jgi:RimJ/RimL family protein N-acetyltransferase
MMKNPFLVGRKIYLRPLELHDAEAMTPWMNDHEVTRTLQSMRPTTEESERGFIERASRSETDVATAIIVRAGDRFIGTAGLMKINWRERHAGFGISIGDKACWGRGYGTEATRLLTAHAFDELNLNRVWLHVYEFNPAGIRAYEKVGYKREGVMRQATYVEGRYHDVYLMAILREDWKPERPMRRGVAPRKTAR